MELLECDGWEWLQDEPVTDGTFEEYRKHPNQYIRATLALNPFLSDAQRRLLAMDPSGEVIASLAHLRNLSADLLASFVRHPLKSVRYGLAGNRSIPTEIRQQLDADVDAEVRRESDRVREMIESENRVEEHTASFKIAQSQIREALRQERFLQRQAQATPAVRALLKLH